MTATQTEIQSQAIGLSAEAFKTFCADISGMFGVNMKCAQQKNYTETVEGLKKHFQELTAVTVINAKGALNGNFQLIFDQPGLFILGNLMIMPEQMTSLIEKFTGSQKIEKNIKNGTLKDAEEMSDAVAEAGNIMVGSWDRVFREGLDKHEHFTQINTFVGNPWDKPEESIGLTSDQELLFSSYKMTAGSYPAFTCGVIFPKAIFSDAETEAKIRAEARAKVLSEAGEKARAEAEEKAKAEAENKPSEAEIRARIETEERAKVEASKESTTEAKEESSEDSTAEAVDDTPDRAVEKEVAVTDATTEAEDKTVITDNIDDNKEPAAGGVPETIQKMAQSAAILPPESSHISLAICAQDIMQKEVLRGNGDDSVQQALTKMLKAETGYMLVGADGDLEGIVSKSDLAGAVSIYLRPIFAKWHRKLDDATLNIRVKWIMTKPVHTIRPETPLAQVMDNLCQFGVHALPVVDQQGKTLGLVTAFGIYQALLSGGLNNSYIGKTCQTPPLVQLGLLVGKEVQYAK